jgi:hypothetical protein
MNENFEGTRFLQLLKCVPDVLDYKTILYVGGHYRFGRNLQLLPYFFKAGYKVDVIEIYDQNAAQLRNDKRINRVILGDIRTFEPDCHYDLILWHHGPEHIKKGELKELIERMSTYADVIIFGCPHGIYEQGPEYGNKHETHLSHYYPGDFLELGMQADAIGQPDCKQGNIYAWKYIKNGNMCNAGME